MIPKKIHYCWFGGNPLPELAQKCLASWKKYCPDYEIIEWNESNFNINDCNYAKEAYEEKKWAFVTDYVRLKVLFDFGGIYMDTDVEIIKPLDSLLSFTAVSGFESETSIPTGLIASEKDNSMIGEFLTEYNDIHFRKPDGTLDLTTNVFRITKNCLKYGFVPNNCLQVINGFTFLPKDYLCPKNSKTGEMFITENTLAIHHFDGSWLSNEERDIKSLTTKYIKKYPYNVARLIALIVVYTRYRGLLKMPFVIIKRKREADKTKCQIKS